MAAVEERRKRVAQMRRNGEPYRSIAEALGVSAPTVMRDVRAIEKREGEQLVRDVYGADGKNYRAKTTRQEYEQEPGFGEPADEEDDRDLAPDSHLHNALASLQMAGDALRREGHRFEVASLLGEIRQEAAKVLATNKALPKVKP